MKPRTYKFVRADTKPKPALPRMSAKARAGLEIIATSAARCIANEDDAAFLEDVEKLEAAEAWIRALLKR